MSPQIYAFLYISDTLLRNIVKSSVNIVISSTNPVGGLYTELIKYLVPISVFRDISMVTFSNTGETMFVNFLKKEKLIKIEKKVIVVLNEELMEDFINK